MENFSFRRDFKNVQWKRTFGLNLLRSAIAGVVWFFIGLATHKTATPMLFFPLIYLVIILPFGLFDLFLRDRGVPWAGFVGFFFNLALAVADPIMYILHRTVPRIVPVDRYKFIERSLVIFVLNNPDIVANEYKVPQEIDRAKVKELLSSRIRPDDNEDEAEVNFLKEEVVVNEAIRAGKTVGGPPKLEISNSIFNFHDLRVGSTRTDTFTISNAGGDTLSGSIKANRKWIKVFQSEIDPTQRKQDVIFRVNTSGLAFGFRDTGTIEIKSNAGTEWVNVTISVEAEMIASLRKEINIPAMAGLGVLGLAIAVTVIAWQMALKIEKEAKLVKLKTEQKQAQQTNQEKHEYTIAQQKTSTIEQLTLAKKETEKPTSQEAVNNCFVSVSPDRWKGEYYNNRDLSGNPSMVRDDGDSFVNFNWGNGSPRESCGIGVDNFSVRWTRIVNFDNGTYRFTVTGDDGFRLYIDNVLRFVSTPVTEAMDILINAGNHTIKMEYYENDGDAVVKLSWQALPTPEQPATRVQSPITYNLTGKWEGRVDNKLAEMSLVQDGNSLLGNIVYDLVTEYLSGEINSTQVVLKGTGSKSRYEWNMGGKFSLDTFYGTIMNQDGDFIRGKFTDEAGRSGSWYVTKSKSSPQIAAQKPLPSHDILSEDEVKAVIEKRVNLSNKNESLDEIMRYYQDSVDYYAYGVVLKDVIRREINGNYKMWPERERRISSSITVIPGNTDNEKTAKFTVHSIAKKGKEVLENENNYEMTLRKQENSILIIREKNNPNTQKTTDNYKPNTTTSAPQARLTKAMQKNPYISFHDNDHSCRFLLSNARVTLLHNDSLQISSQKDSFAIDCTWSSSGSAYVGTWQRYENGRGRVQGTITLWPQYNSDGEIKCFSGDIRNWNDPPADVIKIQTVWCRCSNPPNHNPGAREQYRKPNSPSVHTYETTRSYHWGK